MKSSEPLSTDDVQNEIDGNVENGQIVTNGREDVIQLRVRIEHSSFFENVRTNDGVDACRRRQQEKGPTHRCHHYHHLSIVADSGPDCIYMHQITCLFGRADHFSDDDDVGYDDDDAGKDKIERRVYPREVDIEEVPVCVVDVTTKCGVFCGV